MQNVVRRAGLPLAGVIALAGMLAAALMTACSPPVTPETHVTAYAITIRNSANGTVSAGRETATAGESITLTIVPDAGYELASIRVTGLWDIVLGGKGDARTFTMPAEDVSVTAVFASAGPVKYAISINEMADGAFESVPADSQYEGGMVRLIAIPNSGMQYRPGSLKVKGSGSKTAIKITQAEGCETEWLFEMSAEDVEVDAAFMDESIALYDISIVQTAYGSIECGQSSAAAGDTVTLALLPRDEDYRYRAGSLIVTPDCELTDISGSDDGGERIWTFTMPEEPVSITAEFEEIPHYTVIPAIVENGVIVIEPSQRVRAGTELTVTLIIADPVNYRYVQDSFVIITDNGSPVDFSVVGKLLWTFTMPAEEVIVDAVVECIPWFAITVAESAGGMENGSFTITGTETTGPYAGKAREGDPITVTALPNPGYILGGGELCVTPAVTVTRLRDQSAWSFDMPGTDLEIGIEFVALGLLEIYKGGARRGITIGELSDDKKFYENSIEIEAEESGRNGNRRVIKITRALNANGNAVQQSFGLFSDTEIDLDSVAALSFWARANKQLNIRYVGFGDDDPNKRVVYTGENFNQSIPIGTEWKRYVIPIPVSHNGWKTTRVFFFNASLAKDNYVCVDDIEFIESGVTITEITIPDMYDTLFYGPTDAVKMFKGVPVKLVFTCDDGVITTLRGASNSHTLKYNLNHWLTPFIEVNGNVTFSDGVITLREKDKSGALTLSVNIADTRSNPMTAHITDGLLLDDFEGTWNGTIPATPTGTSGYVWHNNASGSVTAKDYITAANDEVYGGLSAGFWRPAADAKDPRGGRNFEAKNAAGYNTLTFRIRITAGTAVSSDFQKNTVFTFALKNNGALTNKNNGNFFKREFTYNTDGWQEVRMKLSDFVDLGLDITAITGYAFGVMDNQGTALRIALDDIALLP